jgi:hypothetical protein
MINMLGAIPEDHNLFLQVVEFTEKRIEEIKRRAQAPNLTEPKSQKNPIEKAKEIQTVIKKNK